MDIRDEENDGAVSGFSELATRLHIDPPLLLLLLAICGLGLLVLFSASGQNMEVVTSQAWRIAAGLAAMIFLAWVPPELLRTFAWPFFIGSLVLLILVLVTGSDAKGAQRWLSIGPLRFQPSEIVKIALPMIIAAWFYQRPVPPVWKDVLIVGVIIVIPAALVYLQPDLGTALLLIGSGGFTLYLAGLRWRWIVGLGTAALAAAPVIWMNLHAYQKLRVITLLNPASDPTGAGYHITQSKIAIGSGGLFGKGWLNGTQANLKFLPEANTDFIFAVYAEEWGLFGVGLLLLLYLLVISRCAWIAARGQDSFQRLLAGALTLTFFLYVFVNIGMVIGLLPVVGVPLPLFSFGGTSMVSLLAGFGILMSIQTHRKLLSS